MKSILIIVIFASFPVLADMAPGPWDKEQSEFSRAKCKEKHNTIVCHFSKVTEWLDDCREFRDKPADFKFLKSEGGEFGNEKYCRRIGKDKD